MGFSQPPQPLRAIPHANHPKLRYIPRMLSMKDLELQDNLHGRVHGLPPSAHARFICLLHMLCCNQHSPFVIEPA